MNIASECSSDKVKPYTFLVITPLICTYLFNRIFVTYLHILSSYLYSHFYSKEFHNTLLL